LSSDVARGVSSHRFDEGAQRVDQHRVFLVRGDAHGAADALQDLGHLGRLARGGEAMELVRLAEATRARSIVATFFSATAKAVRYSATEPGRAGIAGKPARRTRRERYEIVGVGPLGVLGAGCARMGRGGVGELAGSGASSERRACGAFFAGPSARAVGFAGASASRVVGRITR
jgi:hypothetical protein